MATNNRKKKKGGKAARVLVLLTEILILLALVFVLLFFVLPATGVATDAETAKNQNVWERFVSFLAGGGSGDGTAKGVQHVTINEDAITVNMNDKVKENVVMKGYRNIALFGVDSRTGDLAQNTRTDTIMIASINLETHNVKLVSVYRDTYLNQMGANESYGKCNAAYAYGGGEQAIKMLNSNLDMDITDFVTIGFEGLRDVIDGLGGVYIDVDEEEIKHINNYQISMVESMGGSYTPVTSTGYQRLDGLQATAYCRIRYTAGNDFKRTERQREVLQATLDVAKTASVSDLSRICTNVFSEVYTSLDLSEILQILTDITQYSIIDEGGFPTSGQITTGTIGTKGSCVIPLDLESNVTWLHGFLFDEADYVPSENVSIYSKKIYSDTNGYLN